MSQWGLGTVSRVGVVLVEKGMRMLGRKGPMVGNERSKDNGLTVGVVPGGKGNDNRWFGSK